MLAFHEVQDKNKIFPEPVPDRWAQCGWGGPPVDVETSQIWGHRRSDRKNAALLSCENLQWQMRDKHLQPHMTKHTHVHNPGMPCIATSTNTRRSPFTSHVTYRRQHAVEGAGLITSVKTEIPLCGWEPTNTEGAARGESCSQIRLEECQLRLTPGTTHSNNKSSSERALKKGRISPSCFEKKQMAVSFCGPLRQEAVELFCFSSSPFWRR